MKNVWDEHAKHSGYEGYTNISELENSNDLIIQWLKQIKSKHRGRKLKVLDDGSGIGHYVLASKIMGFEAVGLDISREAVKIAKENKIKVILGDMRNLPFKDESFDLVIAGGSLEHFPETERAMSEIARVLKPNGILLGNVPNFCSIYVITKILQQALGIWRCGYEKSFSRGTLVKILRKNGLETVRIVPSEWAIGKHAVISGILKFIDDILREFSFGGPHNYFYCIKR